MGMQKMPHLHFTKHFSKANVAGRFSTRKSAVWLLTCIIAAVIGGAAGRTDTGTRGALPRRPVKPSKNDTGYPPRCPEVRTAGRMNAASSIYF